MPARDKLNAAFFQGTLAVAALLGWACGSWMVFSIALCALLFGNLLAGDIRPKSRPR